MLTDPFDSDTDWDGLNDGDELIENTNPLDGDTDDDEMLDGWEVDNGLNPLVNDADGDPDGDGLFNLIEYHNICDPQDPERSYRQ